MWKERKTRIENDIHSIARDRIDPDSYSSFQQITVLSSFLNEKLNDYPTNCKFSSSKVDSVKNSLRSARSRERAHTNTQYFVF